VLLGDDMLNMERQEVGVVFVKEAVFTAMTCLLSDEALERGLHHSPGVIG
jgi:hypothetical protein